MFETVSTDPRFLKGRRARFWGGLPASLCAHGLLAAVVLAGATWDVSFPNHSPAMMVPYSLAAAPPPPPPPPPPPAAAKPQPVIPKPEEPVPVEEVAPTIIPEEIPVVPPPAPVEAPVVEGVEGGVEGGIEGGVVGGSEGGEIGGTEGGIPGGVVGGIIDDGKRVIVPRDVELEMDIVSRPFPRYPEVARSKGWSGQLLVRYVISTWGRVKEVTILSPSQHKVLDEAAVEAIREWRFKPMIKDGERREVVHELTVIFKLNRG